MNSNSRYPGILKGRVLLWMAVFLLTAGSPCLAAGDCYQVKNVRMVPVKNDSDKPADPRMIHLMIEVIQQDLSGKHLLRSDSVSIPEGVWASYKITPGQSNLSGFSMMTVKFRPTRTGKNFQSMKFELILYWDEQKVRETEVVVKNDEAVVMELLEDQKKRRKILFRIGQLDPETEKLNVEMNVDARIVPVFALDSDGNPVDGLKKEDFQLKINSREKPFQFSAYSGSAREKSQPERHIILLFDFMFNTFQGTVHGSRVAKQMIRETFPGENFTILKISSMGGLAHIYGPSKDAGKLCEVLDRMAKNPDMFTSKKPDRRLRIGDAQSRGETGDLVYSRVYELDEGLSTIQAGFVRFVKLLENLRYMLDVYPDRKNLFLFSMGVGGGILEEEHNRSILRDAISGINSAETIMFSIDPTVQDIDDVLFQKDIQRKGSLQIFAKEGGGRFFEGSSPDVIVKNIKKSTDAYYELFYTPDEEMSPNHAIEISCRKRGVHLYYVKKTRMPTPYRYMKLIQKKIFVLNLVQGGEWSRTMSRMNPVSFPVRQRKDDRVQVRLQLPEFLTAGRVDVFRLYINDRIQDIVIAHEFIKIPPVGRLWLESRKGYRSFLIFVEPNTVSGVYGVVEK